jgi:hypothetical protein
LLSPPPLGALIDLLDHLPPSLATAVRAGRQTPDVLAGVLALLRDRGTPAALVIDDVQWADGATLDLLRYLGRRIECTRALLVLSIRDDALGSDHPLFGVFAGLPSRCCIRMPLAPLSRSAVAELARRAGRSACGVYEATQGNPFYVTELLAGDARILPASVRDAVLARTALLSPEARDVLELASVAPGQIELEVLDAVVDDAHAAIAQCVTTGLLQLDGMILRFRHELARRAIEILSSRRSVSNQCLSTKISGFFEKRNSMSPRRGHARCLESRRSATYDNNSLLRSSCRNRGPDQLATDHWILNTRHTATRIDTVDATLVVAHALSDVFQCSRAGFVRHVRISNQRAIHDTQVSLPLGDDAICLHGINDARRGNDWNADNLPNAGRQVRVYTQSK